MEVGWGGSLSQFTETLPQVRGLGSEALPKILKRSSLYQVPPSSSRHAWKTAPLPGRSCHYHSFCFPAPRLTFLIHKTTCLMNLPQIAPLKNPVCQIKLNTQLINCIPQLPQSFCVNQNRWLMSNLDTEKKKKKHLTHAFIFFFLFFAVFDHLASRDWENELSWNAVACMICLFRGRRLWPLCEHDLSLLGMCQADKYVVRHLFFRRTQWKSSSPFLSQKAEVHYFSILFT